MGSDQYKRLRQRLAAAVRLVCPGWLRQFEDDLVQAGMIAVMRILERDEENRHFPASYLRKVAYSAVVDEIRRLRARKEVPLETVTETSVATHTALPAPDRRYAGRQIADAIRDCLARLVEPRKQAVTLHLLGYKKPQIARRMGWNPKRASNLVFRDLENLRACLRERKVTP